MEAHYTAYGLQLTSSFALPGAESAAPDSDRLPALSLTLVKPGELDALWSGAVGTAEWRGRQGDGIDLVIERGARDDLMFAYGTRARFRLRADGGRLVCAPNEVGLDWLRVLISKVLPSVSVMRGYEALHAAVLDFPSGVVAILGASGAGKSTLALELLSRGASLFADDQLTLGRADHGVWGYPGTPHMNLANSLPDGLDPEPLGRTLAYLAGERWFAVSNSSRTPRPVAMLCMLKRAADLPLELHTLSASPLLLAPHMLGLSIDAERQRERFVLYSDLIESARLVRLTAGPQHRPAQLADLIEQALERGAKPQTTQGAGT